MMAAMIRRIAIMRHQADTIRGSYMLLAAADVWRARRIEVVQVHGTDVDAAAEALIPQVDLSVMPWEYREFMAAYPAVVNRNITDIRKSTFSRNIVSRYDTWTGPVIVKSDLNFGGRPERRLLGVPQVADPYNYPVYPSIDEVPDDVFADPELVVERFLPEIVDGLYCVNAYLFAGERAIAYRRFAETKIVKAGIGDEREIIPIPDEIVAERERLGWDYGKFDFVINEGTVHLIDANATPTWHGTDLTAQQRSMSQLLGEGILGLLGS